MLQLLSFVLDKSWRLVQAYLFLWNYRTQWYRFQFFIQVAEGKVDSAEFVKNVLR
ncbi:hypothetical protein PR003_g13431 [Phytophthora rubi]|nr:hypothetical protein PR003_g13431 [Phytophthora rubi]